MSERSFELGAKKFKLNKINAIQQFHIARRIAPILSELLPMMKGVNQSLLANAQAPESEKFEEAIKFISPVMNGLSKLSDAESEFVLFGLLASVELQQVTGNWIRIVSSGILMVQDFGLPDLLQIAGRAFVFNLADFFAALPHKSP